MINFLFLMASKVTLGIETQFRNCTYTENKGLIYKWTVTASSVPLGLYFEFFEVKTRNIIGRDCQFDFSPPFREQ